MLWLALKHWPESLATASGQPGTAHPGTAQSDWLGLWALQFSPRVVWLEEAWLLEASTTLRLWGGLDGLAWHMHERFKRLNLGDSLQLHTGPSALAALASWRADMHRLTPATSAQPSSNPPANPLSNPTSQPQPQPTSQPNTWPTPATPPQHGHTTALPLHALSAARPHVPVLNRLGLHTWGQLAQLPRAGVARRWGQGLLQALDQGMGKAPEGHRWLQAPLVFEQALECPHALDTTASLMQPMHQLLAALQGWLVQSQQGALALHWQWTHDARRDTPTHGTLELHTAHPTQAVAHWQRLTQEHLARVELAAPVLAVRLRTLALAPCPDAPTDWLQPPGQASGSASHGWAELLERLSARLGPHAVVHWQAQPGHWPQTQQHAMATTLSPPKRAAKHTATTAAATATTATASSATTATPASSITCVTPTRSGPAEPTWLLHAPLPLPMVGHRPQHHGPLELLAGPQRLEWTHWPTHAPTGTERPNTPNTTHSPSPPAAEYRDYFVARSPQAGLLWVYRCVPTATPPASEPDTHPHTPTEPTRQPASTAPTRAPSPQAGTQALWFLHGRFA